MIRKHIALISILWVFPVLLGNVGQGFFGGHAYAAEHTRRVPAMRERTYKELSKAQAFIDPKSVQVPKGQKRPQVKADPQKGIQMLQEMLKRGRLNSYEVAQVWNTMAFGFYTLNENKKTIHAYQQVLKQTIPEALELSSLRALFQLYYSQGDYKKSIEYIDRWQKVNKTPDPNVAYIKATAYYQLKEMHKALHEALLVGKIAKAQNKQMKESWWYFQVVCYNELKDYPNVIKVLKKLITHYPKKQYWMSLAGMYAEEGKDGKSLDAYYAAYVQGMLKSNLEVVMLAQRMLNANVPYEAAMVLEKGMKQGIVKKDIDNYKLLATAYTMSQETKKAIGAWQRAAAAGKTDGEVYYRLAQALYQDNRNKAAITAYEKALQHPKDLRDKADVWFWLGTAQIQLKDWDSAVHSFQEAAKDKSHRKSAEQYIKYAKAEKKRDKELRSMLKEGKEAPKPSA